MQLCGLSCSFFQKEFSKILDENHGHSVWGSHIGKAGRPRTSRPPSSSGPLMAWDIAPTRPHPRKLWGPWLGWTAPLFYILLAASVS